MLIAILFILLLILPVSYGLIKAFWGKNNTKSAKDSVTAPARPAN